MENWRVPNSVEITNIAELCRRDLKLRTKRFAGWIFLFAELPLWVVFVMPFGVFYAYDYHTRFFSEGLFFSFVISVMIYFLILGIFYLIQRKQMNTALSNLENRKAKCAEAFASGVEEKEKSWSLYGKFQFEYRHGCPDEKYLSRLKPIEKHTLLSTPNSQRENNVLWVNFYPDHFHSPILQFSLYEARNKNYDLYSNDQIPASEVSEKDKQRIIKNFKSNLVVAVILELFLFGIAFLIYFSIYVLGAMLVSIAITALLYLILIARAGKCKVAECTEAGSYRTSYKSRRGVQHHNWVIFKLKNSDLIVGIEDPVFENKYEKTQIDIDHMQNYMKTLQEMEEQLQKMEESLDDPEENSEKEFKRSAFLKLPEYKKQVLKIVIYQRPFGLGTGKLILSERNS